MQRGARKSNQASNMEYREAVFSCFRGEMVEISLGAIIGLASLTPCLTGLLGGDDVLHASAQRRVPLLDERGHLGRRIQKSDDISVRIRIRIKIKTIISNQQSESACSFFPKS